jgi:hypothetical protein
MLERCQHSFADLAQQPLRVTGAHVIARAGLQQTPRLRSAGCARRRVIATVALLTNDQDSISKGQHDTPVQ